MKLENMVKMFVPAVFAANTAYAIENSNVATPEEILTVRKINNNVPQNILVNRLNEDDWYKQEELMTNGKATVLIEPIVGQPGYCLIGLDGFPQVYELPADPREKDGELRKAELILNLAEKDQAKRFYFPCDRVAVPEPAVPVVPPTIPISPEPSKELPYLIFSPGASYLQILADQDDDSSFGGNLRGGSLSLTIHPSITNWYFGGRFSVYGNAGSDTVDINVPATQGPLAGQLEMRGTNDFSLKNLGIGAGGLFGYMFPFDDKGQWGFGLELEHGFMHDWTTKEFTENSAHYVNGNLIEGSDVSNHSDDSSARFYTYLMPGVRVKFPYVCGILSGGLRTDFDDVDGMINAGFAYCPNKE